MAGINRRVAGFWLLAATVVAFFAASSAPSPLYVVYQARWHFSATVLTLVFAVYVVGLVGSLLTVGGLSDFVGRRPVVAVSIGVEVLSMVAFITARGVATLLLARAVQGIATGAAAGALSAGITDLAPTGRPSLAAAVNTASPSMGLAIGALTSGALVQYAPAPRTLVYVALAVVLALLCLALVVIPEVGQRRRGGLRSLRPRAAVPAHVRGAFGSAAPVLIATWAVGGLVLSLGPSIAAGVFGIHNHLLGGLVVTAVAGVSSLFSVVARSRPARSTMIRSSLVLALGVAVLLAGLAMTSTVWFFCGLVIAGAGFGAAFVAAIGSVVPLATGGERAELFAALYVVSYASFGGSAVVAGLAVPHLGLRPTTSIFGAVVIALAVLASIAERRRRPTAPDVAVATEVKPDVASNA